MRVRGRARADDPMQSSVEVWWDIVGVVPGCVTL